MGKKRKKKSDNEKLLAKVVLITAFINLIQEVVELIKNLLT